MQNNIRLQLQLLPSRNWIMTSEFQAEVLLQLYHLDRLSGLICLLLLIKTVMKPRGKKGR